MSKWTIAGAWVLVATLATTITWQIVSAADAQVSDRPPLQVVPSTSIPDSTTSNAPSATSTSGAASSTSTAPASTSSTASGSSSTSTSTSTPPATEAAWSSQTIPTGGGVVVVSFRPEEVVLSSAAPGAGFAAEIKRQGPPEVDVEFESETAKYRVRARWSDGGLSVETESDAD